MTSLSEREMAQLTALADGSLPEGEREAVRARVAESPALQDALARQRRAVEATRAATAEPAPPGLRAALEGARGGRRVAPADAADSWWRRPAVRRRIALRALPVAVAAAFGVWIVGGSSAGPTVAEAARLAERAPNAAAPAAVGGGRLDAAIEGIAFPDWTARGWRPAGVRRARIEGRDATIVHYTAARGGERIGYAIVGGDALERPDADADLTQDGVRYQLLRVGGSNVVTWRRDGHTCVLAGAVEPQRLMALAGVRY